jgi:hypothetical protein
MGASELRPAGAIRRRRLARRVICILGAFCLSACDRSLDDLYGKETTSATHDEAATTHVAVLSVAPWTEVSASLQPSFKLTSPDALLQAIPTTQAIEEKLVEAFMLKLGLGLPRTSTSLTETVTESSVVNEAVDAAGKETVTQEGSTEESSTETRTKEPGQVPTPTLPSGAPSALTLPGLGIAGQSVRDDPFLRYAAATALFQEAALLDQYVKNAAKRSGYVPYLVRMQLSVLAHKRNQPYDIYADMSLFLQQQVASSTKLPAQRRADELRAASDRAKSRAAAAEAEAARLMGEPQSEDLVEMAKAEASVAQKRAAMAEQAATEAESRAAAAVTESGIDQAACEQEVALGNVPEVVPLLVTDNLEAALRSKAIDKLSQFALALNLMIKGVGANVDTGATTEDFAALIGKDLNSLFTIAKMSGNTMRARIGALNQVETRYATISRTHNLSLLIMIPKSYAEKCEPAVTLMAQTTLRHVRTGAETRPVESSKFYRKVHELYRDWYPELGSCIDPSKNHDNVNVERAMDDAVLEGDYAAFIAAIHKGVEESKFDSCKASELDPEFYAHAGLGYLWQDILSLLQSYGISQVSFSVPYKKEKSAPPPNQIALLLDNGTTAAARLQGANFTDASVLTASLQKRKAGMTEPLLVAQAVAKDGTTLIAQFPSPAQWNVGVKPDEKDPFEAYLAIWNSAADPVSCDALGTKTGTLEGKPDQIIGACYQVSYVKKVEDTSPKVTILQSATTIVGNDKAEGKVAFGVQVPKDTKAVRVRVSNAELADAEVYKTLPVKDVKQPVPGTVELRNLDMDKDVIVTVEALDGDQKTIATSNATYQVKLPEAKKAE